MTLDAGKLRHRVTIQSPVRVQNSATGELTTTWVDVHVAVPAAIEPLSVKDFLQSGADQSHITARITIRWLSGLVPTMRLVGACGCHSGKVYSIKGLLEDKDTGTDYVTMPCTEKFDG